MSGNQKGDDDDLSFGAADDDYSVGNQSGMSFDEAETKPRSSDDSKERDVKSNEGDTNVNVKKLRDLNGNRYGRRWKKNLSSSRGGKSSLFPIDSSRQLSDKSLMQTAEELYGEGLDLGASPLRAGPAVNSINGNGYGVGVRRHANSKTVAGNTRSRPASGSSKGSDRKGNSGVLEKELVLENFANASESDRMAAAASVVKQAQWANINQKKKNFHTGDNVLVSLTILDIAAASSLAPMSQLQSTSAPVNKYGFPQGEGKKQEHTKGPYVYVLATVQSVGFKGFAKDYMVKRCDTGECQRADKGKCKQGDGIEV